MTIWLDGRFLADDEAPEPGRDPAPFETMGAHAATVPLWPEHLLRLLATAARCGLPFQEPPPLRAAASELLRRNGCADGVLRLLLLPERGAARVLLTTRPRQLLPFVRLLPTVVPRPADAPAADLKLLPRAFHEAVLQQARAGGADDGIVIAADGAVLETALGNLWLRLDGAWVTPALDGRVLPGIARARLLDEARRTGLPVVERRCDLGLLHRAQGLAHSNAVYGPRAACLLGAPAPAVAIVDTELGSLWRSATRG